MVKKLQKIYPTCYNLLIVQALWQAHYQILSITFKIKCKHRHDQIKCETCGTEYKYCDCFLENANFKGDLIE